MKTLRNQWNRLAVWLGAVGAASLFLAAVVWGQSVPPPVLSIAPLGSNTYAISITNAVTNATYILYWSPVLNNRNSQAWLPLSTNAAETNWLVDGGSYPNLFFQVITGTDWDSDGVLNWLDADPNNPSLGALTIVIDSPLDRTVIE